MTGKLTTGVRFALAALTLFGVVVAVALGGAVAGIFCLLLGLTMLGAGIGAALIAPFRDPEDRPKGGCLFAIGGIVLVWLGGWILFTRPMPNTYQPTPERQMQDQWERLEAIDETYEGE